MGALFGLLAALSISTTELFGRRVTNEVGPIVAASVTSLLAAGTALVIAVVTDGSAIARDMLLGAGSGLGFGVGMSTYLQGVRVSSSAVVGPVSAALTALIPFTYAAVAEEAPAVLGYVGAALAIIGLMFVTIGGSAATNVIGGLPFGTMSGLGYGLGTLVLINVSDDSGSWPIVTQRITAFGAIAIFALARRRPILPPRQYAPTALAAGLFAGLSSVLALIGLSANAAAASVTITLFPAGSVLIGRLLFRDAVTRAQVIGLTVVIAGTVAIVLG